MKKAILLILSLSSLSAISSEEVTKDQVQAAFNQDMNVIKKTLSRPIITYHWSGGDKYANHYQKFESRDKIFRSILNAKAPKFYDMPLLSNFGDGLYTAFDPQTSASFGKQLIEVTVAAGSNFLDFRAGAHTGLEMRKSTMDMLSQYCSESLYAINPTKMYKEGEEYVTVTRHILSANLKCNEILIQSIQDLEIDFVAYNWIPGGVQPYGPCTKPEETSFVLLGRTKFLERSESYSDITNYELTSKEFARERSQYGILNLDFQHDREATSITYETTLTKINVAFNFDTEREEGKRLILKRKLNVDYSMFSVKGFSPKFSSNTYEHNQDYYFIDQFSKMTNRIHPTSPQATWNNFSSISDYKNSTSSAFEKVKESRFGCRVDIYTEDQIPQFNDAI